MRLTARRLRGLIREALLSEYTSGYSVPDFENTESMMLFLDELEPDDTVETDVVDPETGDIWLEAGMTPLEAGLVELEEEEPEAESDPDELDNYDWDAYEQDMVAKRRQQQALDDKMKDVLATRAMESGKDWGLDTLHQARNSPDMWQDKSSYQQWDSPEDYVLGFGQDAAGDIAQSIDYDMDNEEIKWYESLPTREPAYYSDDAGRPTKQTMKDIYADNFYDGVGKAVKEAKAA